MRAKQSKNEDEEEEEEEEDAIRDLLRRVLVENWRAPFAPEKMLKRNSLREVGEEDDEENDEEDGKEEEEEEDDGEEEG